MNEPVGHSNMLNGDKTWISMLGNLVKHGGPDGSLLAEKDYKKGVHHIIEKIQLENVALADVVKLLGAYLVTEDDVPRSRAISFLAELILEAPSMAQRTEDIHYLSEFFTSRLMDWPALHGALKGCHTIITSHRVEETDAISMLQTLNDGVYVRSLSVKDRSLALCIIHKIVSEHGESALRDGIDLAELVIVSIDGEKDPMCLLDGFKAAQVVLQTFSSLDETSVHRDIIDAASEEMFDILSCYFPVSFTPPEHDQSITRDDIAQALELTLLSWSGFHASILDLVEEKMSSIVKQAKTDSIHMLKSLAVKNRVVIAKESRRIWSMLRPELMLASLDGKDYPPSFQSAEDLGIGWDALLCLSKCLEVCNMSETGNQMASVVLSDVSISDGLTCLQHLGDDPEAFSRSIGSVRASSIIFQASSRAGGNAWSMCIKQNGREILNIINMAKNIEGTCLAYILLYSMLTDTGLISSCILQGDTFEIVKAILTNCLTCINTLNDWNRGESSLWSKKNQLTWSRDRSAYNHVTAFMSEIKIIESLMVNVCFEPVWNTALVDALIDGCITAIVFCHGDEAFESGIGQVLRRICASKTGNSYTFGNKLVEPLLKRLKGEDCHKDLASCIFRIVAPVCRDDISMRPDVLRFMIQELSDDSIMMQNIRRDHVIRGLIILEEYFSDEPHASAEEIETLRTLFHAPLPCPSEQVDGIVKTSYQISRRMSLLDQQKLVDPGLVSSLSCEPTMSHFAELGFILGLRKEALEMARIGDKTLLEELFNLLIRTGDAQDRRWLSTVVASIMNKICYEQATLMYKTLDQITSLALPSNRDDITDWWNLLQLCFQALARQGEALERSLDQICLSMYTNEDSRRNVYSLLRTLLDSDEEKEWISKASHATISFLWQQKTYITAKKCIQAKKPAGKDGTTIMKMALIHLISGAPMPVLQNDYSFIGEHLYDFLGQQSYVEAIIMDKAVTENVLTVFKSLICSFEKSRMQIPEYLSGIIPTLLFVTEKSPFGNIRRLVLECLESLAKYIPYQSLHSYRHDVLKTTMAACDDNKRHVRLAAARCRGIWSR